MESLSGYAGPNTIGGAPNGGLYISGCDLISSLSGLGGVTKIEGNPEIRAGPRLSSLSGLSGVTEVTGNLKINNCQSLTQDHIEDWASGITAGGSVTLTP